MTYVEFVTDPYLPEISSKLTMISTFDDNLEKVNLQNGLVLFTGSSKELISLVDEVSYSTLTYSLDISGNENPTLLLHIVELFRQCVMNFFNIPVIKIETMIREVDEQLFLTLTPITSSMNLLHASEDSLCYFLSQYDEILRVGNGFVSSDELSDYCIELLKLKGINIQFKQIDKIKYTFVDQYFDLNNEKLDMLIKLFRSRNYISLYDLRQDNNVPLIFEIAFLFNFTNPNDTIHNSILKHVDNISEVSSVQYLVFQIPDISFDICPRQWLLSSVFQIRKSKLPLYTFYFNFNNTTDDSIDYLKAKILGATIVVLQKINYNIDIDEIKINEDLSITIPVFSWKSILSFKEGFKDILNEIDNWTIILCPSLGIGITMRTQIDYISMVVPLLHSEYLVIFSDIPKIITFKDLKSTTPKNVLEQRGISLKQYEEKVKIEKSEVVYKEDCDEYIVTIDDRVIWINSDQKKAKKFSKEWNEGKLLNRWSRHIYSQFNIVSSILFYMFNL